MQQPLRILLTVVLVILALLAGNWVWNYYLYAPWTRDGKVRAEIITLSPDVSGWVRELHIRDDQTVQQGDPLFRIDDIRYRATLARAEAQLLHEQESLRLAEHQYERRKQLHASNSISPEELDSARIEAQLAAANVALAQAEVASARINLERTQVEAPADGTICNRVTSSNRAPRWFPWSKPAASMSPATSKKPSYPWWKWASGPRWCL